MVSDGMQVVPLLHPFPPCPLLHLLPSGLPLPSKRSLQLSFYRLVAVMPLIIPPASRRQNCKVVGENPLQESRPTGDKEEMPFANLMPRSWSACGPLPSPFQPPPSLPPGGQIEAD